MKREMDTLVLLLRTLFTYILLFPINVMIAIFRTVISILTIIEKTLQFIVDTSRDELLK